MTQTDLNYRTAVYSRYLTHAMPAWIGCAESEYRRWAEAYHGRLRGWIPASREERCLDLGCGPGNVLYVLRELGCRNVEAVDVSPECVAKAAGLCRSAMEAEAVEYLRSAPPGYRLITAFDLLEHFRKDELLELVRAAFAALAPGGVLIVQVPNAESPWSAAVRYGDLTHELSFTPAGLARILGMAGFRDFEARECGPAPRGVCGLARWAAWQGIRLALGAWNLAETGSTGSRVYSRVFLAKVTKPC